MRLTPVFRTFLISDVLVTAASNVAGFQATDATDDQSSESLLYVVIGIAALFAWIAALAGLWRFRNWARVVYVALAGVGLLAHLLLGGGEVSGVEDSIDSLSWLIRGVIIALTYWSPLASSFRVNERAGAHEAVER